MSQNKPLHAFIGDPVLVISPSTQSSDGLLTSNNAGGVGIAGYDGVMFIEILGATDATDVSQVQIQYSSTGTASDAVTSNAGMTCTDAIFTVHPHASAGILSILDFSIRDKGMADAAGKLYATIAAAETGAAVTGLIGIPYGGTRLYPATNAVTVIIAND